MPRKFCPACNRLAGGGATDCSQCGHHFDPSTIVVAPPPKVCLLCGAGNPQSAQTCRCGQHLDLAVAECRALLRSRRTNGAIVAGAGVVAVAAIIGVFFAMGVIWPWMLIGAAGILALGLHSLVSANHLLADLPALPKATLREPRD